MSWVVGLEVGRHGFDRRQLRRGRVEGVDGQQLIDRCGLGARLGEAVALGEGGLLEDADAIDQAVEVLADPRVRPRAALGDSSSMSSARSNSWRACSRWPSVNSLLAALEVTIGLGR